MNVKLENQFDEKFEEYLSFFYGDDLFQALIRLGEMFNCLPKLSKKKQKEWSIKLCNIDLNDIQIKVVTSEIEKDSKEIKRLLLIFDKWIVEELVYILTLRIQIDLVIEAVEKVTNYVLQNEFHEIDKQIFEISKTDLNKTCFRESIDLIKKNWGMPLTNKLLS